MDVCTKRAGDLKEVGESWPEVGGSLSAYEAASCLRSALLHSRTIAGQFCALGNSGGATQGNSCCHWAPSGGTRPAAQQPVFLHNPLSQCLEQVPQLCSTHLPYTLLLIPGLFQVETLHTPPLLRKSILQHLVALMLKSGKIPEPELGNSLTWSQNWNHWLKMITPTSNEKSGWVEGGNYPICLQPVFQAAASAWQRAWFDSMNGSLYFQRSPWLQVCNTPNQPRMCLSLWR